MKTRKVTQYICEFCNKRNYQKAAMASHEKYCTMNPERGCRMCDKIGELSEPIPMKELLKILPEPEDRKQVLQNLIVGYDSSITNLEEIDKAILKLNEKVAGCTACTLAAIRQKGIPVPATSFDYKKETESFWEDYNDEHRDYGY